MSRATYPGISTIIPWVASSVLTRTFGRSASSAFKSRASPRWFALNTSSALAVASRIGSGGGVLPCPVSYPEAAVGERREPLLASWCGVEQSGSSLGS